MNFINLIFFFFDRLGIKFDPLYENNTLRYGGIEKIPPTTTDFPHNDSMVLVQSEFIFTKKSRIPEIIAIVEITTTYF